MNKIPFDISFKERIERGEVKVVTRDNREVTIIKWDLKGNYPIAACVKVEVCNYEGDESWFEERPYAFSKEGKLYKGFPEDKSDIFILVEEPVNGDLEKASKEWLRPQLDKSYAKYGETKMMELTHFDGYAMLDAIEFGAKWREEHPKEKPTSEDLEEAAINYMKSQNPPIWGLHDGFIAGANWQEEKMMAKAIDGHIYRQYMEDGVSIDYGVEANLDVHKHNFADGDIVRVVVIKEV